MAASTYRQGVDEAGASGRVWREQVRRRWTAEQDRDALARLIECDADPFEVETSPFQELLGPASARSSTSMPTGVRAVSIRLTDHGPGSRCSSPPIAIAT